MGLPVHSPELSVVHSPSKNPRACPGAAAEAPRAVRRVARQSKPPEVAEASTDGCMWHINSRVLCGDAGMSGESFFPMKPSFTCSRPEPYTMLYLRGDEQSMWSSPLPPSWRHLDLRLSSSRGFCDEIGVRYRGYMRGDIQDCLSREGFERAVAQREPGETSVEVVQVSQTPIELGGFTVSFEYLFDQAGDNEGRWDLREVTVVIKGVACA